MGVSRRFLKNDISQKIKEMTLGDFLEHIKQYPEQALLHSIFSCLCSSDEKVRWHAISAFGAVMARLANQDMEKARIVMRRCMWMLNDESGGIGWGIPEAFAEAMACHAGLAKEYSHILVSFMREDGFYLELELLQQGLLWGIGRLALESPGRLIEKNCPVYLMPYFESLDPTVRGLAAWVAGLLMVRQAEKKLHGMENDPSKFQLFNRGVLTPVQIGEVAQNALKALKLSPNKK